MQRVSIIDDRQMDNEAIAARQRRNSDATTTR